MQDALVLTPPEPMQLTELALLHRAVSQGATIDIIERLAALQVAAVARQAELEFNQALNQAQEEVRMVVNDADGQKKRYATYRALDKEVRPVYLKHGMSLSFGTADCSIPEHILVTCHVSRGAHTRIYQLPMDASGKGPKGDGALSKPHAILAAAEYGRRCLLKMIFNIVTGDEEQITNGELVQAIEKIMDAGDVNVLMHYYKEAYKAFESNPDAIKAIAQAKIKRQKEIANAAR